MKYILIYIYIPITLFADLNSTSQDKNNYIDQTHKTVSKKVINVSEELDTQLSKLINTSNNKKSIDEFYQNKKFNEETDETFINIRTDAYFQSKEKAQYNAQISVQFPLVKSQKNLNIFIKDSRDEELNDLVNIQEIDTVTIIGLNYFAPIFYKIKSKYTLATHGVEPLIQAKYFMNFNLSSWKIEPIQTFTYSTQDRFEEETNIYFDNKIDEKSLGRFVMRRKTKNKVKGMEYSFSFQYFYSPKENTSISFSQSFLGNTAYEYNLNDTTTSVYNGIYNYTTSFIWRKNIYKKWLFSQIVPTLSFHKKYEYNPNYTLVVLFDFYFGKLKY